MDFHALPRLDLQALCKRNGIRANMTNAAMADALAALPAVDGIEEYAKPPVAEHTPVAKAAVAAEEDEGEGEMQGISLPHEVIILDFHALPRRDLQALCKRNDIRANMANDAMADALAALPAVDGIKEYAKPPVDEHTPVAKAAVAAEEEEEGEREMQGILLPGGPGAAPTPHEVIILDDGQEGDKDLMPAPGVGQRRAGRRPRVEPVASPATRKKAAASLAEKAAEAVPARTTRGRSQSVMVSAPEEEAPKARRMPRRGKTSTEQEEEEKGTQGDVSDGCVVDSSVQERQADVQQCEEDSPIFRKDTVSSEEIHRASEDAKMVPIIIGEAAEDNEVPTSGRAAKAVEEKEPVAAPARRTTRKRAAANKAEIAMEAVPARSTRARSQRVVVSTPEEAAPKERRMSGRAVATKTITEQEEEEKGMQGEDCVADSSVQERQADVQESQDSPVFRNDTVSGEEIHHASEDTEMVALKEVQLAMLKSDEAAKEVDFTSSAGEENEVPTPGEKLQSAAKAIEEKGPVAAPATTTRKRAAASMSKIATEALPARITRARSQRVVVSPEEEAPKARRTSRRAVARKTSTEQEEEENGKQGDVSDDCVVDSSVQEQQANVQQSQDSTIFQNDTVSSEEIHHGSEDTEMVPINKVPLATLKSGEAVEEVDFTSGANEENEVPTSGEMLQSAAKAIEKEDMAAVEEETVVATDEISQRSATVEEGVIEVVTVNLLQATVTDGEGAGKESGFSCDLADVSVEEDGVVAADEMSQRSAILDEEVATVENLSQATVIEEVDTFESLSQATVTEEVATIENLSQATVTDDEWVVKESDFASDLPLVDTARDSSDHIASPLSAGMGEIATKSMSINSITEPVAVEREKEVKKDKECEALGSLSLRKLRIKLKEVAVAREEGGKECKALGSLSLRKLSMKLKEKVAVAQENEADDVPLCNSSTSKPVAVKREEVMKEGNESEALGSLSLSKLRTKFSEKVAVAQENDVKEGKESKAQNRLSLRKLNEKVAVAQENDVKECKESKTLDRLSLRKLNEKVAVAQENDVKEGKESKALDGLSLRKLKLKLKKTLNAQKVIGESHPSM